MLSVKFRRKVLPSMLAFMSILFGGAMRTGRAMETPGSLANAHKEWTLVWNDEFNGPDGSPPDSSKWSAVVGASGFGNEELQSYTARPENLQQEKGNLVITARRKDDFSQKSRGGYTSARIQTKGHFEQKYGRVEARIKMPGGQGVWPAFWMLGADWGTVKWPGCGEIDIVENVGYEPSIVHGSLHGPGYSGKLALTGKFTLPTGTPFSDDFHVFAVEWEPQTIRFFVDDVLYQTQKAEDLGLGKRWVFDHPFFILLNLAVGGRWPGDPDATTVFPVSMLVDYVRVYR